MKDMKKLSVFLFTIALMLQTSAQNSKMDDIQVLMDYTGMSELSNQMMNSFTAMYRSSYGDEIPGLWDTMNVVLNEGILDLMDSIAEIYHKVYTHEEIKSMLELYQTPIGKRMVETMPMIADMSMKAGQEWAAANEGKIRERITPLIEKYAKKEFTFDDFFNADEVYEYDNPKTVSSAVSNNTIIHGSHDYKYSIHFDSLHWDVVPNETVNPVADLTLIHKNEEIYAIAIAETSELTIQQLKAAAIYNLSKSVENVKVDPARLREVNGKDLLCMKFSFELDDAKFRYYSYYYAGDWGLLQFIVMTTEEFFDNNIDHIEDLLSGLHVE